jgi:hypothetical protein
MDNLSEPPHLPVGRLAFIKRESFLIENYGLPFRQVKSPEA